jgi:hypothetical protein
VPWTIRKVKGFSSEFGDSDSRKDMNFCRARPYIRLSAPVLNCDWSFFIRMTYLKFRLVLFEISLGKALCAFSRGLRGGHRSDRHPYYSVVLVKYPLHTLAAHCPLSIAHCTSS